MMEQPQALFVAWRAGGSDNGVWGPVGRLEFDGKVYRFGYTRGALQLSGFHAFSGMPDLDKVYESEVLFPLFANRLLAPSRPEYEKFLVWGGFDLNCRPDPIAILGVTEGLRATDALELFPSPTPNQHGQYVNKFFLHGVRWMAQAALDRINKLQHGESLGMMFDDFNRHDPNAVAVRTCDTKDRFMIGYVPRYLARDVREICDVCCTENISLTVMRINPDAPLQHRILCQMTSCWPSDFSPCSREEFQPISSEMFSPLP